MDDITAKQTALQSTETLATVAHAIIRQQYGEPAYEWDPVTIALEIKDDFRVDVSPEVMDRWCAIQVVMTNDTFFTRLDAFLNICNTLASGVPVFQVFDPVTVEEAAWALTEVALNREFLPFSSDIKGYLRNILATDGYTESNWPVIFNEVFELPGDKTEAATISNINQTTVEAFIDDQLRDLVFQFNQIPSLHDLDDMLLQRSMEEFLGKPNA